MAGTLVFVNLLVQKPTIHTPASHNWDAEAHIMNEETLIQQGVDGDIPFPIFSTYHVSASDFENIKDEGIAEISKDNPMYYWVYTPIDDAEEQNEENENKPIKFQWSDYTTDNETSLPNEGDGFSWEDLSKQYRSKPNTAIGISNTELTDEGRIGDIVLVEVDIGDIPSRLKDYGRLPVSNEFYYISSHFGPRIDPIDEKTETFHGGVDISTADISGQNIFSMLPGKVVEVGYNPDGYGHYIRINHDGIESLYAHMIEPSGFDVGEIVSIDDVIGNVGTTGRSTGPHVHLEIEIDGKRMNPFELLKYVTGESKVQEVPQEDTKPDDKEGE